MSNQSPTPTVQARSARSSTPLRDDHRPREELHGDHGHLPRHPRDRAGRARGPVTVNSFVYLARFHYYDGIVFHRIIPGFVLQAGTPEVPARRTGLPLR